MLARLAAPMRSSAAQDVRRRPNHFRSSRKIQSSPAGISTNPAVRRGRLLQQGGETLQQGGGTLQQGGETLQQGGGTLQQGGETLQQGGETLQQGGEDSYIAGRGNTTWIGGTLPQGGAEGRRDCSEEGPECILQ